jgi:hypothetical protein
LLLKTTGVDVMGGGTVGCARGGIADVERCAKRRRCRCWWLGAVYVVGGSGPVRTRFRCGQLNLRLIWYACVNLSFARDGPPFFWWRNLAA